MTTMTEAFDAQMTDSGDNDVSMYPGMVTADSWLSVEEGIEVEMGDDDEAISEYEMADEGYTGEELQDIEVYDISRIPSPFHAEDHPFVANSPAQDTELMHIPSSDGPALDSAHPHTETVPANQGSSLYNEVDSTPQAGYVTDTTWVSHDFVSAHLQDAVADAVAGASDPASIEVLPILVSGGLPAVEPSLAAAEHVEVTTTTASTDHNAAEQQTSELESHSHQEFLQSGTEFAQHDDHGAEAPPTAEDFTDAAYPADEPAAVVAGSSDPHEISDGVYIDPPPPVLLSLPPSAESGDCSLFNLPASSSLQSPSSSAQPDTGDAPHLLLHERPTLYYEPLSAVFTALRQEQCIQNMPGFSEAELVLDAYDLQLSISEDNVYTHEVTLHELNVIHDGSDLSGPLRLRLKVFAPRFVTRYTMLRDQIARLALTGDGDEAHADVSSTEQQYESTYDEHPETQGVGLIHTGDGANREAAQQNDEPLADITGYNVRDSVSLGHGDSSDTAVLEQALADTQAEASAEAAEGEDSEEVAEEGAVPKAAGAVPRAVGTEMEMAREAENAVEEADAEYDESEETLDADKVRENAGEEDGDYVEHAESPGDQEELGEELLEELGGEAKDEVYPHTGAADDQPSLSEDGYEYEHEERSAGDAGQHNDHREDPGFLPDIHTDAPQHTNSADDFESGVEDTHPSIPKAHTEDTLTNSESGHALDQDTTELFEDADGDGLNDDWDDTELDSEKLIWASHSDALSRRSSTTTLASRTSKRAFEEVELDDFDDDNDDVVSGAAASSPDIKRLRTQ